MAMKIEAGPGERFDQVSLEAQQLAEMTGGTVWFEFNGVTCFVTEDTNLEWLYRDYSNSWTMGWKEVGPNCLEQYDSDTQSEFERKTEEEKEKRRIQDEEYRRKDEAQRKDFEDSTIGITLDLCDTEAWNKCRKVNSGPYGKAALDYAEAWAKLMQIEISKGKTVRECAEYTQNGLGFFGITGFMYGCAVGILSKSWKHGEELRKWHNKEYNHDGEGVVNPAILTAK